MTLTCRGAKTPWRARHAKRCVRTKTYLLKEARQLKSFDPTTSTFRCQSCMGLEQLVRLKLEKLPRRPKTWSDFEDALRRQARRSPRFAENARAHPAALITARRAGRGGHRGGPLVKALVNTFSKPGGPKWLIDECPWCGKLVMLSSAPSAERVRGHASCWQTACSTDPDVRDWRRERRLQLRAGTPKLVVDRLLGEHAPIPRRRGRGVSAETLTRDFGWAVRHILGGATHEALASEAHVTRQAVTKGIARILDLLPEPDLCDQRLARYVQALRDAGASAHQRRRLSEWRSET